MALFLFKQRSRKTERNDNCAVANDSFLMPLKAVDINFVREKSMMKILLVDDDTVTLNSISKRLSEFGYDVVTARNGIEALQEFIKNHFDLVITDIAMPRMNGITLVEEIRNGSSQQYVPAIALFTNPCLPEYSLFDALYRKTHGVERLLDSVEEAAKNGRK